MSQHSEPYSFENDYFGKGVGEGGSYIPFGSHCEPYLLENYHLKKGVGVHHNMVDPPQWKMCILEKRWGRGVHSYLLASSQHCKLTKRKMSVSAKGVVEGWGKGARGLPHIYLILNGKGAFRKKGGEGGFIYTYLLTASQHCKAYLKRKMSVSAKGWM